MMYKPAQILTPHSPECSFKANAVTDINRIWVIPEHRGFGQVKRDLAGRHNSRAQHDWLVFRCNDPDCPAELAIYLPMIMFRIRNEVAEAIRDLE